MRFQLKYQSKFSVLKMLLFWYIKKKPNEYFVGKFSTKLQLISLICENLNFFKNFSHFELAYFTASRANRT